MKFRFPILFVKHVKWSLGLMILGIVEIVASLLIFLIYICLHMIPAYDLKKPTQPGKPQPRVTSEFCVCLSKPSKEDSRLIEMYRRQYGIKVDPLGFRATFDSGMALIEISLLTYALVGVLCVVIALMIKRFDKIICLIIIIVQIFFTIIHIIGLMLITVPGNCNLDDWRYMSWRWRGTGSLTISNALFTFLIWFPCNAYWCYLVVYMQSVSEGGGGRHPQFSKNNKDEEEAEKQYRRSRKDSRKDSHHDISVITEDQSSYQMTDDNKSPSEDKDQGHHHHRDENKDENKSHGHGHHKEESSEVSESDDSTMDPSTTDDHTINSHHGHHGHHTKHHQSKSKKDKDGGGHHKHKKGKH